MFLLLILTANEEVAVKHSIIAVLFIALALPSLALADGHSVYIVEPKDGAVVSNPVKVIFGLSGMGVAPAGVERANTGHHHLLIDTELANLKAPIPSDEKHLHFGGGQTETTIELAPGSHTLQLVLGDYVHVPHDPPVVSKTITITVK